MKPTYKFTFPFTGQVKTQLVIAKNRLIKPKNVKRFEEAVRACLAEAFPFHLRPIEGYLRFHMVHYTQFKRDEKGIISPTVKGDLDNTIKTLADCFQPIYKKMTKLGKDGEMIFTQKGNPSFSRVEVSPGVISDDKYIMRAGMHWVPVHHKKEERMEVFISVLTEEELFTPPSFEGEHIIDLSIS